MGVNKPDNESFLRENSVKIRNFASFHSITNNRSY